VVLRAGTYRTPLAPANSGTSGAKITWRNHGGEYVLISVKTGFDGYYYYNVLLWAKSWHVFDGINIKGDYTGPSANADNNMILAVWYGSNYNEFKNMDIDGNFGGRVTWRSASNTRPCLHNWIHNCTFHNIGSMYFGSNNLVCQTIGPQWEDGTNHTTIENCDFHHNGHCNLEFCGLYSVIKNNFLHNEGWLTNNTGYPVNEYYPDNLAGPSYGKWGHRNFMFQSWNGTYAGTYNLAENNRFGTCGPAAEVAGGESFGVCAPRNIIRYNDMFGSINNNVLFKQGNSEPNTIWADYNTFYNNTIFNAGRYNNSIPPNGLWQGDGIFAPWNINLYVRVGNTVINNIINSTHGHYDIDMDDTRNTIANNFLSASGDPLFVDTYVEDPTSLTRPNLALQASSSCINAGTNLTLAKGSGSGSTSLTVGNALFFQDGTWGSDLARGVTLFPDWIAIGTVDNVVKISSINYNTNVITLASPMTWADNAKIWLYKNSSGVRVLYGRAPDIGAHEFDQR
jgi:hypothetical protein